MTLLDYIVIGLYAAGMLAIGWYYSRRVETADDYLLGGRSMSPVMIGLSLFATLTSTLTYLALPGEMIKTARSCSRRCCRSRWSSSSSAGYSFRGSCGSG